MTPPDALVLCPHCDAPARPPTLPDEAVTWTDSVRPLPSPIVRCHACSTLYRPLDARRTAPRAWRKAPVAQPLDAEALYRVIAGGHDYRGGGALVRDPAGELEVRVLALRAANDTVRSRQDPGLGCVAMLMVPLASFLALAWWKHDWVFALLALLIAPLAVSVVVSVLATALRRSPGPRPRTEAELARAREELARPDGPYQDNLRVLFERLSEVDPEQRRLKAEVARNLGRFDDALRLLEGLSGDRASTIQHLAQAKDPWVSRVFAQRVGRVTLGSIPSPPPKRRLTLLDQVKIDSPCDKRWEDMQGDGQTRFCDRCQKNVHDLAAMDRGEAERLLTERKGSICVKL